MAIGAYALWGLLPLYIRQLHVLPPLEFVGWRVLLSLPVCLGLVTVLRQWRAVAAILRDRRRLGLMTLSALLIGANWLVYVMAIHAGHIYAASIGYYVNPLVNFLLGTVFLKERLHRAQWLAMAIAVVGVALLAGGALDTLWVSLALAGTFGGYGLVRKLAPVDALPGLTVETLVLVPVAAGLLLWSGQRPEAFAHGNAVLALTAGAGVVTVVPLLLFAGAARRLPLSTLGFVQFLAPTLVFGLGLAVFREPLHMAQLACLGVIWVAIGVFCWDLAASADRLSIRANE
jgi:chloramphenicol-sensitive protein RarD